MHQKTSLNFSNMVFDPQIDQQLFEFTIPEGTDVLELDQF